MTKLKLYIQRKIKQIVSLVNTYLIIDFKTKMDEIDNLIAFSFNNHKLLQDTKRNKLFPFKPRENY